MDILKLSSAFSSKLGLDIKCPSTKEKMKLKKVSKIEVDVMDNLLEKLKVRKKKS